MSFQNKGPWVLKDVGALTDGETDTRTSLRIEQKRAYPFFMDALEGELFSNKKQVVQPVVSDTPISTPASVNFSFWGNENVNSERSRFINLLQNNPTVSLSMSHAGEDSLYLNTGTRGARVNLEYECASDYPFLLCNSSNTGEDRAGIENVISMGHDFAKEKQTASLVDNTINKVNGNCMLMGNQENFNSMFPSYRKANEIFMPVGMTGNEDIGVASRCPTPDKLVKAFISAGTFSKENASFIAMNKFESAKISFGGFQHGTVGNNTSSSGKVISSYDLVISEPSLEASESLTDRSTMEHSADQIETVAPESMFRTENVSKKKVKKIPKSSPNNFPHNVRSLMSTGILDGVPVKYVSWSREKTIRGVIKGTGYLCGCIDCKLSKNLSASEFERHAACKTGHPTNNIYFETGKTIYAVVQELKNTPQEMLFEAIQNITGSPINQEKFQTWKASLEAAAVMNFSGPMQKSEVTKPS